MIYLGVLFAYTDADKPAVARAIDLIGRAIDQNDARVFGAERAGPSIEVSILVGSPTRDDTPFEGVRPGHHSRRQRLVQVLVGVPAVRAADPHVLEWLWVQVRAAIEGGADRLAQLNMPLDNQSLADLLDGVQARVLAAAGTEHRSAQAAPSGARLRAPRDGIVVEFGLVDWHGEQDEAIAHIASFEDRARQAVEQSHIGLWIGNEVRDSTFRIAFDGKNVVALASAVLEARGSLAVSGTLTLRSDDRVLSRRAI